MINRLAIFGRAPWVVAVWLLVPLPAAGDDAPIEPESCIPIRSIRSTDIIDNRTIVFYMAGGRIWLNRLPNRCPGLKVSGSFAYRTSLTRLCNVDVISPVQQQAGGVRRTGSCGLGQFEAITKEDVALLKDKDVETDEGAAMPEIETLDEAGDDDEE